MPGVYTQSFNRAHGRVGHVFQGRYKAILVERDRYLLELARYIVLNPLRAGRPRSRHFGYHAPQRGKRLRLSLKAALGSFHSFKPKRDFLANAVERISRTRR